jgi:N-acetyl sugar amidotransferase
MTEHRTGEYRICARCVMDSSDPDITFDASGNCNYCTAWLERVRTETFVNHPTRNIDRLVAQIKHAGRGREYDCIIGVSGGVDSTYVAYLVKKHGLRPLAVHMDNGWNSELAVDNIHRALKALDIELYTHVIDWEEFRDLQLSFFRASVTNLEIPTDHGINAILHRMAVRHRAPYIITGGNIRGEGIYPKSWGWYNLDLRHLRAVHGRFGAIPLRTFPQISLRQFAFNTFVRRIKTVPILNYVDYNRLQAMAVLVDELGWRPYGGKHYESVFTRFFQGYVLPRKFNVDKRRAHLATLVVAGDITRDHALAEIERDPYADCDLEADLDFVLKKLNFTPAEFEVYMKSPGRQHRDYPTNAWFFEAMPQVKRLAKRFAMAS